MTGGPWGHYELYVGPRPKDRQEPGESSQMHVFNYWNVPIEDVLAAAKSYVAKGHQHVWIVDVCTDGDRKEELVWGLPVLCACKRCQHTWVPRVAHPVRCPSCKSPLWDTDRVRKIQ